MHGLVSNFFSWAAHLLNKPSDNLAYLNQVYPFYIVHMPLTFAGLRISSELGLKNYPAVIIATVFVVLTCWVFFEAVGVQKSVDFSGIKSVPGFSRRITTPLPLGQNYAVLCNASFQVRECRRNSMADTLFERLNRLLPGGKGVWIPMTTLSRVSGKGLERMDEVIDSCIEAGADAIVLQKGSLVITWKEQMNVVCHVSFNRTCR